MYITDLLANLPLPLQIYPVPFALFFWVAYFWTQTNERKPGQSDSDGSTGADAQLDRHSWKVIQAMSRSTRALALLLALFVTPWAEGPVHLATYFLGIAMMVVGTSARRSCFALLQESFTADVRAPKDNKLVEKGIYRYVRHPSYTAGMIFIAGFGVAMTNWLSLAVMIIGGIAMYAYRVPIEERAMVETLGNDYVNYMQRTSRFIPFVI